MHRFDHEKLDVYQAAVEFVALAEDVVENLPPGQSLSGGSGGSVAACLDADMISQWVFERRAKILAWSALWCCGVARVALSC